jgi:hypothetical protein
MISFPSELFRYVAKQGKVKISKVKGINNWRLFKYTWKSVPYRILRTLVCNWVQLQSVGDRIPPIVSFLMVERGCLQCLGSSSRRTKGQSELPLLSFPFPPFKKTRNIKWSACYLNNNNCNCNNILQQRAAINRDKFNYSSAVQLLISSIGTTGI